MSSSSSDLHFTTAKSQKYNTRDMSGPGLQGTFEWKSTCGFVGRLWFFAPLRRLFISMFSARLGVTDSGDKISIIRLTRLFLRLTRPTDSRRLLYHFIWYAAPLAAAAASLINIGFGATDELPFFAEEWCDKIRRRRRRQRRASFRDERRAKRGKNASLLLLDIFIMNR